MVNGSVQQWIYSLLLMSMSFRTEGLFVNITYLLSGVAKGAVCLDGSPPAYHHDKGFGTGVNSWLIQMEGGGWCNNVTTCLSRKNTRLGSSKQMVKQLAFSGILSNKPQFNPAGGLTSILHCDSFKALLPMGAKVKCFSDAGYFINVKDISGAPHIEEFFGDVVRLHGSAKNLPLSCTSRLKPNLCFFPQNVVQHVRTPLFLVNAAYDSWQIKNILAPSVADPRGVWRNCKLDILRCSSKQLQTMQGFRLGFLRALYALGPSSSRGYFINSCYAHCQTEVQETWFRADSPKLANKTIAKALGDWFFDKNPFQKIDCPYPCDKTCHNRIFNPNVHPFDIDM